MWVRECRLGDGEPKRGERGCLAEYIWAAVLKRRRKKNMFYRKNNTEEKFYLHPEKVKKGIQKICSCIDFIMEGSFVATKARHRNILKESC